MNHSTAQWRHQLPHHLLSLLRKTLKLQDPVPSSRSGTDSISDIPDSLSTLDPILRRSEHVDRLTYY